MRVLYLVSVWIHLLAAMIWIGGMAFIGLVLVPATRKTEYRGIAVSLIQWTGSRFRFVAWPCLAALILTGAFNLFYRGVGLSDLVDLQFWQSSFGQILAAKLVLVSAILLLSALHDFVIGPRAVTLLQANPSSAAAMKLRRRASWFGRLVLLLALIVVALGTMLVRGLP